MAVSIASSEKVDSDMEFHLPSNQDDATVGHDQFISSEAGKPTKSVKKVLDSIRDILGYAAAARDLAADLKEDHPSFKHSAIVSLVKQLGKKTRKQGNIVYRYAGAMASAKNRFKGKGIGAYLLKNINKAVIKGKGVVFTRKVNGKWFAGLNPKTLGFTSRPAYISRLNVPLMKYVIAKGKISVKGAAH